jgi:multidrug efflux pump subunit AcrB
MLQPLKMAPMLPQVMALVNGKRSVYLNIAKSADASTWEVVQNLKKAIPKIQANCLMM